MVAHIKKLNFYHLLYKIIGPPFKNWNDAPVSFEWVKFIKLKILHIFSSESSETKYILKRTKNVTK